MKHINPKLIEELELVCARVEAGNTLTRACHGLSKILVNKDTAFRWNLLREQVEKGQCCPKEAVYNFIQQMKFQSKIYKNYQKKSLGPKVQIAISNGLSVLVTISSILILNTDIWKMLPFLLASLLLSALAAGASYFLFGKLKRIEIPLHWLVFLQDLYEKIRLGMSLPSAFNNALENLPLDALPANFLNDLESYAAALRLGKDLELKNFPKELPQQEQRFVLFIESYLNGIPIKKLLENWIDALETNLQDELEKESEALGYKLLAPLFLFQFPVYFLALFGAIFSSLEL